MNVRFAMKLAAVIACVFVHTTNVYGQYSSPSQKNSSTQLTTKPIQKKAATSQPVITKLSKNEYKKQFVQKTRNLNKGRYTPEQGLQIMGITKFLKGIPFPTAPKKYSSCYNAFTALVKVVEVKTFARNQYATMNFDIPGRKIIIEHNNIKRVPMSNLQIGLIFCHEVVHIYDLQNGNGFGLVIDEARAYSASLATLIWLVQKFGLPKKPAHKKVFQRVVGNDIRPISTALALLKINPPNPVQFFLDVHKVRQLDPMNSLVVYPHIRNNKTFANFPSVVFFAQLIRNSLLPALAQQQLDMSPQKCHTWKEIFPHGKVQHAQGVWKLHEYKRSLQRYLAAFNLTLPVCVSSNTIQNWKTIVVNQRYIMQRLDIYQLYDVMKKHFYKIFKNTFGIKYRKYFGR